jgi:glycerate kinase
MKVLVAPNSYKGSFSCTAVAEAIAVGVRQAADVEIDLLPIADGGDGTIDALYCSIGGRLHQVSVEGPHNQVVMAPWLEYGELGIVEMAAASGLSLLGGNLSPLHSHTKGTGQMIRACLAAGMKNIVVCVGGSASTDGGAGVLIALGARFWKRNGEAISLGASELGAIAGCDLREAVNLVGTCYIAVAVDVSNPLLGTHGAASIYAPQKGASPALVQQLELDLRHYADLLEMTTSRQIRNMQGTGAAGGTAFGIACGLGAEIISGFDWMSSLIGLEDRVQAADLVITGEGQLDEQSFYGKSIGRLAALCKQYKRPLIAIPAVADANCDWQKAGLLKVECAAKPNSFATLLDISDAAERSLRE